MTFKQYLKQYVGQETPAGDLARDFDDEAPDNFDGVQDMMIWMETHGAAPATIRVCHTLYLEYLCGAWNT